MSELTLKTELDLEVEKIYEEMSEAAAKIGMPRKASGLVGYTMEQAALTKLYFAMVDILDKHTFAAVKRYCHEECIPIPTNEMFNPFLSGYCCLNDVIERSMVE